MINVDDDYTPVLKQFKLANSEEIICEVIEWDDEENPTLIVRAVMKIINIEDYNKGTRFFAFRPWMSFKDDPKELQTLNPIHIVSESFPNSELIKYYTSTITSINEQVDKKRKPPNIPIDKIRQMEQKFKGMSDEEIEDYLDQKALYQEITEDEILGDSGDNIIPFKPPKTIH
tara:strand:+ start:6770 stop:7288 length:519 start_codon:yes stop_codon:yes gene_type:complete